MSWRRHLAVADPFHVNDHETQDYDKTTSNELLEQAPATRKELWGYYLYYNGVSNSSNKYSRNDRSYVAMI